jgi:hypothetical protein
MRPSRESSDDDTAGSDFMLQPAASGPSAAQPARAAAAAPPSHLGPMSMAMQNVMVPPEDDDDGRSSSAASEEADFTPPPSYGGSTAAPASTNGNGSVKTTPPPAAKPNGAKSLGAQYTDPSALASAKPQPVVRNNAAAAYAAAYGRGTGGGGGDGGGDYSDPNMSDEEIEIDIGDVDELCPASAFGAAPAVKARPKAVKTAGFGGDSDADSEEGDTKPVAPPPVKPLPSKPTPTPAAAVVKTQTPPPPRRVETPPATEMVDHDSQPLEDAMFSRSGAALPDVSSAMDESGLVMLPSAALAGGHASELTTPTGGPRTPTPAKRGPSPPPLDPESLGKWAGVTPQAKQPVAATAGSSQPKPAATAKPAAAATTATAQGQQPTTGRASQPTSARAHAAVGDNDFSPPAAHSAPQGSSTAAGNFDEDEWDAANRVHDASKNQPRAPPPLSITWDDACRELRKRRDAWGGHITPDLKRVSVRVKTKGFLAACWSCWHHDIVEGSPLYEERDFVLALQKLELDHSNEIHRRILLTIWRMFVRPKRDQPDPPTTGSAWEQLGFQGTNPATDLRSTGLFGLMQLLFLVDYCPQFANALFEVASSRLMEFPLAIVSFNMTALAMNCLLERLLNDTIVTRHKKHTTGDEAQETERRMQRDGGSTDVSMVLNEFYVGLMYRFYETWTSVPTRRVMEFQEVKKGLEKTAREKTSTVLSGYVTVKTEFSREKAREKREARVKAQLDPIMDKGPSRFSDF